MPQAGQERQGGGLGFFEIVQNCPGGAHRQRGVFQAKALEGGGVEVFQQALGAAPRFEAPGGQGAGVTEGAIGQAEIIRVDDLGRAQAGQFGTEGGAIGIIQFGDRKFAGGDIHIGYCCAAASLREIGVQNHGGQVVVGIAGEQAGFDQRSGGHHAHYFTREEPLDGLFPLLFRDGDMVAFFNQPDQVVIQRVIGDAGQGHTHPAADRAGGQDDLEFSGNGFGVFIEGFVEIAQAEKQDAILVLAFGVEVLLADWGDFIGGHGLILQRKGKIAKLLLEYFGDCFLFHFVT